MFSAAISGDLETIKRLLNKDPSLVRCQYAYRTPLYFAVRENQVEVARFLLEHGADQLGLAVNDSLLAITHDRGYGDMEKLLLANLAGVQGASTKGNAVAAAIRERNREKVRGLLDAAPELLQVGDERSNQPIHWAVMTRQIDLIDDLVARGANINAQRFDGARPIHLANGNYHYRGWRDVPKDTPATPAEVLAHLIARSTPLGWAAKFGKIEMVELLLGRGAQPNLPDDPPWATPLAWANRRGHAAVAELLKQHGAH
jgi:ankyrin repeat protein